MKNWTESKWVHQTYGKPEATQVENVQQQHPRRYRNSFRDYFSFDVSTKKYILGISNQSAEIAINLNLCQI